MHDSFSIHTSIRLCIVCAILILIATVTFTKAGTILLMGIGLGTPNSIPPPPCSNSLDFSDSCNSQYIGLL